jgi:hypothetical protein
MLRCRQTDTWYRGAGSGRNDNSNIGSRYSAASAAGGGAEFVPVVIPPVPGKRGLASANVFRRSSRRNRRRPSCQRRLWRRGAAPAGVQAMFSASTFAFAELLEAGRVLG